MIPYWTPPICLQWTSIVDEKFTENCWRAHDRDNFEFYIIYFALCTVLLYTVCFVLHTLPTPHTLYQLHFINVEFAGVRNFVIFIFKRKLMSDLSTRISLVPKTNN